ncbi:3-deoxy-D-manno-octulosonic acid transferase [Flavobacterium capsici]|uniref:3-deoxy-D-manno-octulosonic acid transferase n=1 Tax=Flavobacterium capsici TaxID=3075618 RepID=A0AA96EYK1_9FLAO|nr:MULTISPECIES: glycosyltransferase N-terminal domain-containing protein [unclassified Flavobacterium]WNM19242.1 glycosyltransferase N-terminal domain-containing protein [Flavobacterium sp. PMR2A8]WNM20631.1 glycosyltransferase N-terminal domain-containing protein [Flavobacterium sp. PMTSA4]
MLFLYNLLLLLASQIVKLLAFFSPKIKLFVDGRKTVFQTLTDKIKKEDKTIWFHAASLGEFEQGLPVIEKIKTQFPNHKIVVTFFSPSGYEVRKNNAIADVTVYLPLDTKSNAKRFIEILNPEMVFFIKYEYWPNYLNELKIRNIKTYLISGIFRENQAFFKWYGGFYKKALETFDYFFVQNENSKTLLHKLSFNNVKISGDTRFDRVVSILERNNSLDFIEQFKNNTTTIVIGSSWPKDENYLVNYINNYVGNTKFIFAPHNIKTEQIQELKNSISKKTILFSEKENQKLEDFQVMIVDTIGILTKIYSYADIAYVGGGFGTAGLHNILEPATFGTPIVIGPNYSNFAEAIALVNLGGCISVTNQKELNDTFDLLLQNEDERYEKGHICSTFVQMNKGATSIILNHVLNETLN